MNDARGTPEPVLVFGQLAIATEEPCRIAWLTGWTLISDRDEHRLVCPAGAFTIEPKGDGAILITPVQTA